MVAEGEMMPRCKKGDKLLNKFWKKPTWENHKKFDNHTVECAVCSGRSVSKMIR
jgi:hypothetical protein